MTRVVRKRNFSTAKRKKLAEKGHALPDGSYPITDTHDLKSAITLAQSGHGNVAAAKRLIKRRAKQLGAENMLPEEWVSKLDTRAPLDRSPKKNWVENAGGLPMYIRRIANHLHAEKGMQIGHAIAVAVNAAKKMCASGDLNFPGKQNVNAGSHAEACAAVAEWEKKKASARVSKGIKGRKLEDWEYIDDMVGKYDELSAGQRVQVLANLFGMKNAYKNTTGLEITDEEFDAVSKELDGLDDPDDPDTADLEEFTVSGEVSKVDEDKRLAFGWASVAYLPDGTLVDDKQGDVLDDVEEVEKSAYDFVVDCRDGGEMHIRKGIGTLVESMVFTPEKIEAMGIPAGTVPLGWWVGFRVTDDEVWKAVKDGRYRMFSVHGRGTRKALD